jgi:hypothetical protein
MASFQDRVVGALKLDAATFEEVEHDATAINQAAAVVAIAALARAVGGLGYGGLGFFVLQLVLAAIGWFIGSAVLWLVGTRLLPGNNTQADLGQMLRVAGFAQAPNVLAVFSIMPFLGFLISFVGMLWALAALVVGVKAALDYDDIVKAIIVCVVAWVVMMVVTLMATTLGVGLGMAGRAF